MREAYRCWAEVDLDALRTNVGWIRHRAGASMNVMTVVKADAYGHGLKQIAALLMQSGTDIFGVANLAEAQNIRAVGAGWPVLMLGACLPGELECAIRDDVMATISTLDEARQFARVARRLGRQASVQIKVDTGMNRLGVRPEEAVDLAHAIARIPALRLRGIYTHFAAVEDDAMLSEQQRAPFESLVRRLQSEGVALDYVHCQNSGGLLLEPGPLCNTIRPGLMVYGILPPGRRPVNWPQARHVRPVLEWKCRVSLVREVLQGAAISYGGTFVAPRKLRVATLSAGYGDGYLRAGSNRAQVLVRGRRCPVLGRVTMDQMMVDVSRVPRVAPGDEAVLIGAQGRDRITTTELAEWWGTIPWEVLTSITYRVPRMYRGSQAA
jgi:alanine racemase